MILMANHLINQSGKQSINSSIYQSGKQSMNNSPNQFGKQFIFSRMALLSFCFALMALAVPVYSQWQVNVNITPSTYFSIQPNMTSLDFGDITSGKSLIFYLQNDGNTHMNVSMLSNEGSRVKMFVKTSSDEENNDGPSCESAYEAYANDAPLELCKNLGFTDSADRIAVAIRLEPLPTSPGGSYESTLLISSQSIAGGREYRLPITYSITPRPVVIKTESDKI